MLDYSNPSNDSAYSKSPLPVKRRVTSHNTQQENINQKEERETRRELGWPSPMATQALNALSVFAPAGAMGTTTLLMIASALAMAFTTAVHSKRSTHSTQLGTGKASDEDTDVEPWSSEDEASPTPHRPRSVSPRPFGVSNACDVRDDTRALSKATDAFAASPVSEPLPPLCETTGKSSPVSERFVRGAHGRDEAADTLEFDDSNSESRSVCMLDGFACESEQRLLLDLGWRDVQSEEECALSADEIAAFRNSTGDATIARFKVCPQLPANLRSPWTCSVVPAAAIQDRNVSTLREVVTKWQGGRRAQTPKGCL